MRAALAAVAVTALAAVTLSPQQADASPAPAPALSATDAAAIARTLPAGPEDATAGSYYDSTLGRLVVNITDGKVASLVRAVGGQPRAVRNTRAELDSAKATLDAGEAIPGTTWGTDLALNRVVVTADPTVTGAKLAQLKKSVGSLGDAVLVKRTSTKLTRYIAGGDAIFGSSHRCSLGFNVKRAGKPDGFLTAGHCGKAESVWHATNGGPQIATTENAVFPGRDYAIAGYPATGAVDHPSAVNLYNGTSQPIAAARDATVGETVQRSGSTTGLKSGTVRRTGVTVNYPEGQVTGLTETTACAEPGDSGGPYFSGSDALGLLSGGSGDCTSGGMTYFQPVAAALAAYGATVG
ncbi:serine protease [Streptomyces hiroshimensis]|uniref:Serine protease n=1 Tax=Streptomyces hiroshimensis TaxID=66424 RepID=A0ABQ2YZM4_9ACTN|nr:serine protease [Streptomyces hiroshimensis]